MPIGIPNLSFRSKVVMLAVALVAAIQLITLFSVLNALKNEQLRQADASVTLAGVVYDEYMRNRTEQLSTTVSVLVQDFPFREAIGLRDVRNIEDVLENHSRRAGADAAAVFDLNGEHIASSGGGRSLRAAALAAMARYDETGQIGEPTTTTAFVDDKLHQAVTVPVVAPTVIAWVTMAFPVDAALAADIRKLTGLESSFVSFDVGRTEIHATTLPLEQRDAAFAGVLLGADRDSAGALGGTDWITRLAPIRSNDGASRAEDRGVYVALQLPMMAALRAYRDIRNNLIAVAAIAVVLTISAAVWLSRMVTRPIASLVEAARRLGEGIYTHKIEVKSTDEFAVLAAGFNSMQQAIANREQDIVHMAHHDSLSGLPTREIVVSEMRDAIAATDQLAVVNFVLHRFDELASSLGHRTADKLIQLVAGRLRDQLEDGHLLGHLKHQEFVLVLPDADRDEAERRVVALQTMLRAGLAVSNANVSLQIKAGIALYPAHGVNASELLRCAAIARDDASHHLGAVGVYVPGQEEASLKSIRIVGEFPRALQNGDLWLEFQPKVDCESLGLTGAEALVRWHHPEMGRLSPEIFVPAIEQAGGITQLTRWVIDEAAKTMAAWKASGIDTTMSVNVSADDLIDDYLPRYLDETIGKHAIDPARMTLEVTESSMMHDIENSLDVIGELRRRGFRIAIDDFGTGHSALAQLKRLPVDELKIDKSFVMNLSDPRDEAVVRTAIELAHQFGLTAVAEGVENDETLTRLRQLGCETAQGFLISRSLRAGEFLLWARNWSDGRGADIVSIVETGQHRPPRSATGGEGRG